jgi:regulator of protease activity HflC (stomatin/prohibitin superfamily)
MADESVPESPPPPSQTSPSSTAPVPYLQLTQSRVPLDDAGQALTLPDASGRVPIVVLPDQPFRIRNGFVIAGVIAVVVGLLLELDLAVRGGLIGIGAAAIFLGVFQSFVVPVPEGARALLLKSGRYHRTLGAGRHIVPPWVVVSHVVTVREIPFEAVAAAVSTSDDVRMDVDLLLTFTIVAPEKFVFAISAPDFDQVCLAASLDAIRNMVRAKHSNDILDLGTDDTDALAAAIGAAISPYGAEIQRAVITHILPPAAFMASREARRLAVVQRDEQTERFALEERLQADREALKRQRIQAKRERIELQAANEALRLQHLEERLQAFPNAARQDVLDRRIEVAQALAGNTRAMVQVGPGGDVADALVIHTLAEGEPQPGSGRSAPVGSRARRDTGTPPTNA